MSGLLMVMFVCSVMAAGAYYYVQFVRGGSRNLQLAFILFTLAAPMLLMVIVSLLRAVLRRSSNSKKRP